MYMIIVYLPNKLGIWILYNFYRIDYYFKFM